MDYEIFSSNNSIYGASRFTPKSQQLTLSADLREKESPLPLSSTHSSSDVALAQNTQNDYHHNNHRHCAFLVLHWQFYSRAFPPLASMKRKLA